MGMDNVLKRNFVGIALALIATVAYFQARSATQVLGISLSRRPTVGRARATAPEQSSTTVRKSGQAVLERNPFDSVTGPFVDTPPPRLVGASNAPGSITDPLSSPSCQGVEVLIVTESSDPWWSLATLRESGESRARLRRVGDGIAGRQVAFIGYNPKQQAPSVWMEGGGTLCQATLFRPSVMAAITPAAAAAPPRVDRRREDPLASFGSLRFVPARQDGRLIGLRLFGIRPGSLLSTLGLQNGDRLETINGMEIASPQKAVEAYARLSTAKRLSVRLVRLGRPVQIDLNIG